MKSRILTLVLALMLAFTAFSDVVVFAGAEVYFAGPIQYTLTEKYLASTENASMSGEELTLQAGGEATFEFYLPFNAKTIELEYVGEAVPITVTTSDGKSFVVNEKGVSPCFQDLDVVERIGEKTITFSSEKRAVLSSITYTVTTEFVEYYYMAADIDMSEEEYMILSAVLIKEGCPLIMVNGSKRYIDNYDINKKPIYVDGSMYLPVHTLARALNLYYEDLQDKKYVLLRREDKELVFTEQFSYSNNRLGEKEPIKNMVHYQDGTTYLPVRYVAEYYGRYVGYKNGMVAIDDNRYYVADMLDTSTSVGQYIEKEFKKLMPKEVDGKTYHVAQTKNASDNNDGSFDAPFRTISRAGEVVQEGDTVIVHEGTYRETVTVKNSGTPTAPIVFKAADGEKVVISALEEIKSFAPYGESLVTARVTHNLGYGKNQVYYGNKTVPEARYPNEPKLTLGADNEPLSDNWPVTAPITEYDETELVVTNKELLNQPEGYWDGATFQCLRGWAYATSFAKVEHSVPGSLHFKETSIRWWATGKVKNEGMEWGYILGHRNAIDLPGEWVLENGTLYMMPPEGVNIEDLTVEVKARQLVADLADNSCVHLDGFETIGGSMRFNNGELCMVKDCNIRYNNHWTFSHDQQNGFIDDAKKTALDGPPMRGEVGLFVGGENNIIVGNIFDEAAGAAIYGAGCYMYVENNLIKNCGYGGSYVGGITYNAEEGKGESARRGGMCIVGNTAYNAGRSPVQIMGPSGGQNFKHIPYTFAFNEVYNGTLTSLDTGVTYTYFCDNGTNRLQTEYNNNMVYSTVDKTNPYSMGLYQDGGTTNINTFNNLVFCTQPGVVFTNKYINIYTGPAHKGQSAAWDNATTKETIVGGRDGLEPRHYPYGMMFDAGSTIGREPYTKNYELIMSGSTEIGVEPNYYSVKLAELGPGAERVGDDVRIDKKGDWLKFSDVDFHEDDNRLTLYYKGDRYGNHPTVTMVLDDLKTGREYKIDNTLFLGRTTDNRLSSEKTLPAITGKHDVYIKIYNPASYIDIVGIQTGKAVESKANALQEKSIVYCAYFDDWTSTVPQSMEPAVQYGAMDNDANAYAYSTWTGVTMIYKDIQIESLSDMMMVNYATGKGYGGQKVLVRLNSPDSEPVGEFVSKEVGWNNWTEEEVKLTTPVEPGKYDIYLTFENEDPHSSAKTMNIYYVKFANKAMEDAKLNSIIASKYNLVMESLDGEFAPTENFGVDGNGVTTSYVNNTWPGTTFIYNDVEITEDVTKAIIKIGSGGKYAGQSMQIRIGSENAEPIAELVTQSNSFNAFAENEVALKSVLKAGKYDFYITFMEPDGKYVGKSANFSSVKFLP